MYVFKSFCYPAKPICERPSTCLPSVVRVSEHLPSWASSYFKYRIPGDLNIDGIVVYGFSDIFS